MGFRCCLTRPGLATYEWGLSVGCRMSLLAYPLYLSGPRRVGDPSPFAPGAG